MKAVQVVSNCSAKKAARAGKGSWMRAADVSAWGLEGGWVRRGDGVTG